MVKKIEVPDLHVGDKVTFRGHALTIIDIKPNGYIEAWSPSFHVTTDDPKRFVRIEDVK